MPCTARERKQGDLGRQGLSRELQSLVESLNRYHTDNHCCIKHHSNRFHRRNKKFPDDAAEFPYE